MNWGYKILFVYIFFVAGIIVLVAKSSMQNQDLVTKDYYEQELKYQDKIDQTERANALSSLVKYEVREHDIMINFPQEMKNTDLKAHILLYCTADKNKDIEKNISTRDGIILMPFAAGNKGLHELKISWTANNTEYYYEHKLFIQ